VFKMAASAQEKAFCMLEFVKVTSVLSVQRHFRTRYGKNPPTRTGTSVGRAGLSILHLPRHTWGSHRVLVRCENNFENYPFSLYIARSHIFSSACKINS
jgi:hypothetical protein